MIEISMKKFLGVSGVNEYKIDEFLELIFKELPADLYILRENEMALLHDKKNSIDYISSVIFNKTEEFRKSFKNSLSPLKLNYSYFSDLGALFLDGFYISIDDREIEIIALSETSKEILNRRFRKPVLIEVSHYKKIGDGIYKLESLENIGRDYIDRIAASSEGELFYGKRNKSNFLVVDKEREMQVYEFYV